MSTIKVETLQNLSGVEVYTAKAWANFNGTGTIAIRDSGNVSSLTDLGTGYYNISLTNARPDANFATIGSSSASTIANPSDTHTGTGSVDSSTMVTRHYTSGTAAIDPAQVSVAAIQ